MSITIVTGNIFTTPCRVIVNPVNCVGVMGAGLALECRLRFPDMFKRYQQLCQDDLLKVGKLWLAKPNPERWVLNFPTKTDWKAPSKKEYIELGLAKFAATYQSIGIESIAFPLLGADRGGLPMDQVEQMMQTALRPVANHIDIEIYRYDAKAFDELFATFSDKLNQIDITLMARATGVSIKRLETLKYAVTSGAYYQLNQLIHEPGIGPKTLESIYQFLTQQSLQQPQQAAFDL